MTDEQWLWLFINEALDADEKLKMMCHECQNDATSNNKCIRCGKPLGSARRFGKADFVNPNFDPERFDALANGTLTTSEQEQRDDEDVDYELLDKLLHHGEGEQPSDIPDQ